MYTKNKTKSSGIFLKIYLKKKKKATYTFMFELGLKRSHAFYQLLVRIWNTALVYKCCWLLLSCLLWDLPISIQYELPSFPPFSEGGLKWISVACNQKSTSTQTGQCVTKQTEKICNWLMRPGITEHFPIPEWKAVCLWKQ